LGKTNKEKFANSKSKHAKIFALSCSVKILGDSYQILITEAIKMNVKIKHKL